MSGNISGFALTFRIVRVEKLSETTSKTVKILFGLGFIYGLLFFIEYAKIPIATMPSMTAETITIIVSKSGSGGAGFGVSGGGVYQGSGDP